MLPWDLVAHAVGVDHHAGVLADDDAVDADAAAVGVHAQVDDPGGPGGAEAGEFAVHIAGVGHAAAVQQAIGVRLAAAAGRQAVPAGAGSGGLDEVDGAAVVQMAGAVVDGVFAGRVGQFVDHAVVRERVGQCRHAAQPGCAHDRRHVVADDAPTRVAVGRRGGAVAHFQGARLAGHAAVSNSASRGASLDG